MTGEAPRLLPQQGGQQGQQGQQPRPLSAAAQDFLDRRQRQLGISLDQAQQVAAPEFREARRLGSELGQSPDAALTDLQRARNEVIRQRVSHVGFQKAHPVLSEFMADVKTMPALRDDLGNLQTTEGSWGWVGRSWRAGRDVSRLGTIGTQAMLEGRQLTRAEQLEFELIEQQGQAHAARDNGYIGQAIELVGTMTDSALTGAGAALVSGPAAPVTVPMALYAQSWRLEAGNLYAKLVQDGYTPEQAREIAIPYGSAIALVEAVGFQAAATPFRKAAGEVLGKVFARSVTAQTRRRAFMEVGKDFLKSVLGESGTEYVQEVLQMMGEERARATWRPDKPSQWSWDRAAEAFTKTLKGMVVLGGLGAGGQTIVNLQQAADAEHQQRVFQHLAELEDQSKVAAEDPELRSRFVQDNARRQGAPEVYIDGAQFGQLLRDAEASESKEAGRSTVAESLERILPGIGDRIAAAEAEGSDVVLPTGDFLAKLGRTELGRQLMQHARFDPDGKTAAESKEILKDREKQVEQMRQEAQERFAADQTFAESARKVEDRIYGEIAATQRLQPKQARAAAQFYRDFIALRAAERGMSPEEFDAKYPLRVVGEGGRVATFAQAPVPDSPAFKAWFGDSKALEHVSGYSSRDAVFRPKVFYHGTNVDFTQFEAGRDSADSWGLFGNIAVNRHAIFFATEPSQAAAYSAKESEGPNVQPTGARTVPVYLRVENPLDLTEELDEGDVEALAKASGHTERFIRSGSWALLDGDAGKRFVEEAKRLGYDGVILNEANLTTGEVAETWAVFEPTQIKSVNNRGTFDPKDPNILRQDSAPLEARRGDQVRGGFAGEGLTTILYQRADVSTFLHESAHYFLTVYSDLAAQGDVLAQRDMDVLLRWFGVKDLATWNAMSIDEQRPHHEAFAYSFEQYLFDAKAPSMALEGVFARFKRWLGRIYTSIRDELNRVYRDQFGVDLPILTGEVRQVMDRMLASDDAMAEAEAIRAAVPMFQTQEESGMTDAQWADHQAKLEAAREAARAALTRDSLRQMDLLHGAQGRVLKERQAQYDAVREQVRREVAIEVARRPEYAVPRFIKKGELVEENGDVVTIETEATRKLHRETVERIVGAARAAPARGSKRARSLATFIRESGGISWASWQTFPGERGAEFRPKGTVRGRKGGGMAWDYMAEAAREAGYGPQGIEYGEDDYAWFIEAISDAAAGEHTYPLQDVGGPTDADAQAEEARRIAPPSEKELRAELKKDVRAELKEQARRRELLAPFRGLLDDKGVHPDEMAELFGEDLTGEGLVRAIVDAAPMHETIAQETDARMLRDHGELSDPQAVERAVTRALHEDARLRFVAAELRAFGRSDTPARVMVAAAKEAARITLGSMTFRDMSPKQFSAAEVRLARQAVEALKKGDNGLAVELKRKQLRQGALARAALDLQQQVEKQIRNLSRFRRADKDLAKTRNVDIVNAARWVLSRYGLASETAEAKADRAIDAIRTYDPNLYQMLEPILLDAAQGAKEWRSLTVDQLTDLLDRVDGLWDDSRRDKQILVGEKLEEYEAVRGRVLGGLQRHLQMLAKRKGGPKAPVRKTWFGSIRAGLRHVESFVLELDGGRPGVLHEYLFRLIRDPYDRYQIEKNSLVRDVFERARLLPNLHGGKIDASRWLGDGAVFKDRGELIGALLHSGSAYNLESNAVARGWVPRPDKFGEADLSAWWRFVNAMIEEGKLTQADFDFVQHCWDVFEAQLKPRVQEVHHDLYGVRMDEQEATPIETPWGTYRGGYFPASGDPDLEDSKGGKEVSIDGVVESGIEHQQRHPSAPKGFTITRQGVHRALLQDIRLTARAFDDELRFIHMQQPGKAIQKLLNDREVQALLKKIDPHAVGELFFPWLGDTMNNRVMQPGGNKHLVRILVSLRRNVGLATMFGNVANALQQVTGLANSALYVPLRHLRAATAEYARAPRDTADRIVKLSPFMELRLRDQIGQIVDDVAQLNDPSWRGRAQGFVRKHGYFLQRMMQNPVDIITWSGAFNQATVDGKTQKQAVAWADTAVRRSQASGTPADISAAERASAVWRLFTQFSTFWLASLNTILQRHGAERAVASATIVGLSGVLAGAIAQALRGGWDDEDDDGALWDDVVQWTFGEALGTSAAIGVPFAGPMALELLSGRARGRLTPGATIGAVGRAGNTVPAFWSVLTNENRDLIGRDVRDLATLLSLLSGVPITLAARPVSFGLDVLRGDVTPGAGMLPAGLDTVRGLVTGSAARGTR